MTVDFLGDAGLPAPVIALETARAVVSERFGVTGEVSELGSQQDANFRVDSAHGSRFVLKFANPAFTEAELVIQHRAMEHLARRTPGLRLPMARQGLDGQQLQTVEVGGESLKVRLLEYVDGAPIMGSEHLAPATVARLGEVSGRVSQGLADFAGDALDRVLQWDLRAAADVVTTLSSYVRDSGEREAVVAAASRAAGTIGSLAPRLRIQAVHGDITDNNVVCDRGPDGRDTPAGVIDFGDLAHGWTVAELAVTCSSVLHHHGAEPASVLPAIRAFHAVQPLTADEADALWSLVVLRGCVLVVSGRQQVEVDADNAYADAGLDREWRMFEAATSVPTAVMDAAIRDALGLQPAHAGTPPGRVVDLVPASLDLSVLSDHLDAGRWLEPGIEDALFADELTRHSAVAARHGEYRLTRAQVDVRHRTATLALGVELAVADEHEVRAPWPGVISSQTEAVTLSAPGVPDLLLHGVRAVVPEGHVGTGDLIGRIGGSAQQRVWMQLSAVDAPPAFVSPDLAAGWLAVCPDPGPLLGLSPADTGDSAEMLLGRRDASFAPVQEHYFDRPPRIERGWRHHLVDVEAQTYVDVLNNVTLIGHGHPVLADAVARQWRRLNTNSRFHYASVVELSERLAGLLPDPLDTVFLVNSGSEANDLALRLAWAHTDRRDVIAVGEAYHGWTDATDAISTSIADNPGALETRPDWVHALAAPNAYRGRHRGDEAYRYAAEAVDTIRELAATGRPPAAFLCEPYYGNAGGMPLPDGYLRDVFGAVREAGGLCIADEVQVGCGRLGTWWWGFEQQDVVPDIVTVAKGMGNGHPLGAVITTHEIAASYRKQGYFFSSAGGSPVSSVVGCAVLDVLEEEGLRDNARRTGAHLRARLEALAERHELIGAVHGDGLYLGLEFVRDRQTLEPAPLETAAICERLRELGVIVQPTSDRQCVLKIKPPLCLTTASADAFADALDEVLTHGW